MKKHILLLLMLVLSATVWAQSGSKISGTVVDQNNQPIPGATIIVKGTQNGVTTSTAGKFVITAPKNAVLTVSYIGYQTVDVPVNSKTKLDIKLQEDNQVLDDVVVVGYGAQKRVNLTGAVATVDVDKVIGNRPVTDIARGLQGVSPGLLVTTSSGNIGQAAEINLRGIQGSLNAETKPLILLDNVEIGNLMMVNPSDIESVSVLKDAAASSIYGARGTWGVILLTSKKGKKGKTQVSYDNSFAWSSPMNTPEIADGADGVEYMLKCYRRTAPNQASFNILGAYYDDLSVDRIRQWKQIYGGQKLGDELVAGRDYEIRGGKPYFYRPWNVDDVFLNDAAPQMKHNLSITGGSESTTFFLNMGILDQKGIVKITPEPDRFTRFNGTARVESKINKWFTARGSIMFSHSDKKYPNFRLANAEKGSNEYWFNIYRYPETYPYGTVNGMPLKNIRSELEQANMNKYSTDMGRFSVGSTVTFMKGWTADIDYTYDANNNHRKIATSPIGGINHWADASLTKYEENFFPAEDYVNVLSGWNKRSVGKAYTTFEHQFGDHTIKVMAGGDIEYYKNESQTSKRYVMSDPSKPELGLTDSENQETSGSASHWATLGFFGRVNYSFKDRYLLEFNFREDGASRFNKNYKWGQFPSVSAGYIVTNEPYMKGVVENTPVSFVKIRGSWGSLGNNNLGGYSYESLMGYGKSNWYINNVNKSQMGTPSVAAPELTWETVETLDFGADIKLFKNSLSLEFDWFQRKTKDMATSGIDVPNSMGTSAPARNFGELRTRGWELTVTYNKMLTRDLSINVMGTLSDAKGKVTKHARKEGKIQIGGQGLEAYEGQVLGEIWGYESDRLFTEADFNGNNGAGNPTWYYGPNTPNQDALNSNGSFHYGPGDVKYNDIDGSGEVNYGAGTTTNPGDMKIIGNTTPRYIYGLRIGLNWKGIDFSAFLQGVGKRDYWGTGSLVIPSFTMAEAVYKNQVSNYWTPQNTGAFYPAPSNPGSNNHNGNWQCSTRYLLDMSYLRMKNITLGYTLPFSWTKRIGINKVRVFASGENLFTIDNLDVKIDPEVQQNSIEGFTDAKSFGRTYPYFRTWSFGLQINM